MHLGIRQLGYVFTGWGVMVAVFAVFVAPRAQARFGTPRTLYVTLALLALDLLVIAAFTSSQGDADRGRHRLGRRSSGSTTP